VIVIVGHGPSVRNNTAGAVIDSFPVVRLKQAQTDPVHRGMRTDYICSRAAHDERPGIPFWLHPDCIDGRYWSAYWKRFSARKPSVGTCAVFCAAELLEPKEIGLIGFDNVLNPKRRHPDYTWGHDSTAEHAAVHGLGIRIINLAKEHP
jgi:hypothetical protein